MAKAVQLAGDTMVMNSATSPQINANTNASAREHQQLLEWKKWHEQYQQKLKRTQWFWLIICLLSHLCVFAWRSLLNNDEEIIAEGIYRPIEIDHERLQLAARSFGLVLYSDQWAMATIIASDLNYHVQGMVMKVTTPEDGEEYSEQHQEHFLLDVPSESATHFLKSKKVLLYPADTNIEQLELNKIKKPSSKGGLHEINL